MDGRIRNAGKGRFEWFYRLEADNGGEDSAAVPTIVDYARGALLMESSDEEDVKNVPPRVPLTDESGSDSDECGFVSLSADNKRLDGDEEDLEIDLNENTVATLDTQVAEYTMTVPEREGRTDIKQTRRLAVVNLDWDYVRAVHLYKIFSLLVSPAAPLTSASASNTNRTASASKNGVNVARGRVLSACLYPSEFGKKPVASEKEGLLTEVFRKKRWRMKRLTRKQYLRLEVKQITTRMP